MTLALFGGAKTIETPFRRYNSIGSEEVEAARAVVESGVLSKYLGCWDPDFYGGPRVREFEARCARYFGVDHAVAVNSWTSGLIAAVGAAGIEPGDEVIVTPWTMCASATAILHWNAIPVFADIDPRTFCLDPASVEANLSPYTKAIMAVDIFGQSADVDALKAIADRHDLRVISDAAQAPGALDHGRKAGTMADVGGYSLNYHKHIHTGEGGIIVTNEAAIAERAQLIRNHAEAVVGDRGTVNLANMVGYNFRLGEIESAIGIEQLKKLDSIVARRQQIATRLAGRLSRLEGLQVPFVRPGSTHVYYIFALLLDTDVLPVSRDRILSALEAEGVSGLAAGYANVHLLPMYQQRMAFGSRGFPWTSDICRRDVSYERGICPVAEEYHAARCICYEICLQDLTDDDVDLVAEAFEKVWSHMEKLG